MKIRIQSLVIETKEGKDIVIDFPKPISYFYGKVGAGKSTIPRLIDFCFGGNLVETPALQQEFLKARLTLKTDLYDVVLSRNRHSGLVTVQYRLIGTNDWIPLSIPAHTYAGREETIVEGQKIENISDLLFHLAGKRAPFVKRSKTRDETELIRLSFRDMLWYCYLSQEEIDSSFFNLGKDDHEYKRPKSRDIMRNILGYHREEISKLEVVLDEIQKEKANSSKSLETLKEFLKNNSIQDSESISKQITALQNEYQDVSLLITNLREEVQRQDRHIVDKHKDEARLLAMDIIELSTALSDLEARKTREEQLRNEYISASVKEKRANTARSILKDVNFEVCPQCGASLTDKSVPLNHCSLCTQPLTSDTVIDLATINEDLRVRINELTISLGEISLQKAEIQKEMKKVQDSKATIDSRLMEIERDYDSKFLSKARDLERKRGIIESEINALKRLLPLPQEVLHRERRQKELELQESTTKEMLDRAILDAEQDKSNLHELESLFLDTLIRVGLPGLKEEDVVSIGDKDFIPTVKSEIKDPKTNEVREISMQFANLGSGGKKTIFKACYALAIHRFAVKTNAMLPRFLIMDTPMKNISERENKDIFKKFYEFLYEMASGELKDLQMIIVDKEYYEPTSEYSNIIHSKHMTPDDPDYPPLIDYYKGY